MVLHVIFYSINFPLPFCPVDLEKDVHIFGRGTNNDVCFEPRAFKKNPQYQAISTRHFKLYRVRESSSAYRFVLVRVCSPLPKTLTLFMTKICNILHPIYDLTKSLKPIYDMTKTLFQTCASSLVQTKLNYHKHNL